MGKNNMFIGVDIGGTKCAVVLGNQEAVLIDRLSFPTETSKGPMYTIHKVITVINSLLDKNKISINDVNSIGISCGGPLDSEKGIIQSPPNLPGWDNISIVNILENAFEKKTYLENDANACAVAEWRYGAGKGCRNMIFLTFGTGLGAGLILDGRLYRGTNGLAGEVGHIRLAEDGPEGYGKSGSFEGFCSGGGIALFARAEIISRLSKEEKVSFCPSMELAEKLTAKDICIAALKGDPVAVDILRISAKYLGLGISILIDILNPERIIIGSIFARCREIFQPVVEAVIGQEALEASARNCRILPAGLGEQIGDYAALAVAMGLNR